DEDAAATTLAVLWNAGSLADQPDGPSTTAPLALLLREPFARLGSLDPELDASFVAHAVVGELSDFLWQGARPSRAQTEHLVAFCLRAVTAGEPNPG
ncbi:MAG: TetR/AcrR family transcriptional regulator, partial [Acidimicrobiales bacterium]